MDLYAVVATILPVLFIGVAIEAKALEAEADEDWGMVFVVVLVVVTALGELAAISVLSTGRSTELGRVASLAAVGVMLTVVLVVPIAASPLLEGWRKVYVVAPSVLVGIAVWLTVLHD